MAKFADPFLGIGQNVHVYYTLQKIPDRIIHLIGNASGSSERTARVYGNLLDSAHLDTLRKIGISMGEREECQAVVQPFETLAKIMTKQGIPYDHLQLHKYLAWEVPLLRF